MKQNEHPAAKLAKLQKEFIDKRDGLLANAAAARIKVADTSAPPPFNEDAAIKRVAKALANDAIHGTETAEIEKGKINAERAAAGQAIIDHNTTMAELRKVATRLEADAAALLPQIKEIDSMIRSEVSSHALQRLERLPLFIVGKINEIADLIAEYHAISSASNCIMKDSYGLQFSGVFTKGFDVPLPFPHPKSGSVSVGFSNHELSRTASEKRDALFASLTGGIWPKSMAKTHYEAE